ncbi:hypothetical protein HYH03_012799 [Edaphochlamys debaryana]|uniref:Protein SirB1 N-terminal domain-containing protein n=1 Tax=Edaphochlamys debaryana TaxID=47281 RepID=A0A835XPC9_9CHLO|nr:hypothetical protein HYH03_012799 [Edaphochlamys debaryana]|eukprot:KAG2488627.1 hypothetical protein HYH03_012799 [Edaphochlamys debaryana]
MKGAFKPHVAAGRQLGLRRPLPAVSAFGEAPEPSPSAPSPNRVAPPPALPPHLAPRGPTPQAQRHVEHLLFDFSPRFLEARRQGRGLTYLSLREAEKSGGLQAVRAFLDFQTEVERAGPGGPVDLLRGALLAVKRGDRLAQARSRVDSIAAMVQRHLRPGASPAATARVLSSVLFDFYGFRPAGFERVHHPDASSLAHLLTHGTGGPTALGILYILVAERVGLRLAAVSAPSRLLLALLDPSPSAPSGPSPSGPSRASSPSSATAPAAADGRGAAGAGEGQGQTEGAAEGGVRLWVDPYGYGALLDEEAVGRLIATHLRLPGAGAGEGAGWEGSAAAGAEAAAALEAAWMQPAVRQRSAAEAAAEAALRAALGPAAAEALNPDSDEEEEGEGEDGPGWWSEWRGGAVEEAEDLMAPLFEPQLYASPASATYGSGYGSSLTSPFDGLLGYGASAAATASLGDGDGANSVGAGSGAASAEGAVGVPVSVAGGGAGGSCPRWYLPYLAPVGRTEVVMRLLRNLREAYWTPLMTRQSATDDPRLMWQAEQALCVLRMLRCAAPHDEEHAASEAACLAALGRRGEAAELLRGFLGAHPEALGARRTLWLLEAEAAAHARLAFVEQRQRDRQAAEEAQRRTLRARLAGLNPARAKAFNPHNPKAVTSNPDYFSRMYGRLWDDNYFISSLLENGHMFSGGGKGGDGEEEEEEGGSAGGGGSGASGGAK